jgi:hypothetical protein
MTTLLVHYCILLSDSNFWHVLGLSYYIEHNAIWSFRENAVTLQVHLPLTLSSWSMLIYMVLMQANVEYMYVFA